MWGVLEHKIENSKNRMERLWHKDILDDAMKLVEVNWLIFVTKKENSEIISEILDYTLLVWIEGGEKENFFNANMTVGRCRRNQYRNHQSDRTQQSNRTKDIESPRYMRRIVSLQ
jgi:hypothetical protein